jgi:hypothetical protein
LHYPKILKIRREEKEGEKTALYIHKLSIASDVVPDMVPDVAFDNYSY